MSIAHTVVYILQYIHYYNIYYVDIVILGAIAPNMLLYTFRYITTTICTFRYILLHLRLGPLGPNLCILWYIPRLKALVKVPKEVVSAKYHLGTILVRQLVLRALLVVVRVSGYWSVSLSQVQVKGHQVPYSKAQEPIDKGISLIDAAIP